MDTNNNYNYKKISEGEIINTNKQQQQELS